MLGDQFTFLSNRGSKNFASALEPLGGRAFQDGDRHIDLLYYDTYGGKRPPEVSSVGMQLMDRRLTIPLDHKSQMASLLLNAGMNEPRVFFAPEDVPDEPGSLWIIKNPLLSSGKEIHVVPKEQVAEKWSNGSIIQELVQDLLLVEERKFTLRMYLLVHDCKLYLYPDGFAVVHGAKYVRDSCDPAVQFVHDGYMKQDSSVELRPLKEIPEHETLLAQLPAYLQKLFVVFSDFLNDEGADTYCLFGADFLVRSDLSPVLIEMNDRPNIVHTALVNSEINIPMLRAMCCVFDLAKLPLLPSDHARYEFVSSL